MGNSNGDNRRDGWYKAGIVLKPVSGLLAALTVAMCGFIGSKYLNSRQENDLRVRLYTELISKREEAESALRKDMFTSIIETFLKADTTTMEEKVLQLELLAYNFHECLNLTPLFVHLNSQIPIGEKPGLKKRLEKVAREVNAKQLAILKREDTILQSNICFDSLRAHPEGIWVIDDSLTLDGIERDFGVKVLEVDTITKEIEVRLEISAQKQSLKGKKITEKPPIDVEFSVGYFDFPMIDNTRLSEDQRCAIVLNNFEEFGADISLVYFPGAHASLKEKPYYEEIVDKLLSDERK